MQQKNTNPMKKSQYLTNLKNIINLGLEKTCAKKEKQNVTNFKKTSMIRMKKESYATNIKNVINPYMA